MVDLELLTALAATGIGALTAIFGSWRSRESAKRTLHLSVKREQELLQEIVSELHEAGTLGDARDPATTGESGGNQGRLPDSSLLTGPEPSTASTDAVRNEGQESSWLSRNAALLTLVGVLVTALAGPFAVAYATKAVNPPPIACIDERAKAVQLVEAHPLAWEPLPDNSAVQKQCRVNETVERVLGTLESGR